MTSGQSGSPKDRRSQDANAVRLAASRAPGSNAGPRTLPLDLYQANLLAELRRLDPDLSPNTIAIAAAIEHVAKHTPGNFDVGAAGAGTPRHTETLATQCTAGEGCAALCVSKAIRECQPSSQGGEFEKWAGLARTFHNHRRKLESAIGRARRALEAISQGGREVHARAGVSLAHYHHDVCALPARLDAALRDTQARLRSVEHRWAGERLSKKPADVWLDRITFPLLHGYRGPEGDRRIAELLPDGGSPKGAPERVRKRRQRLLGVRRGRPGRPKKASGGRPNKGT